jgi:hypothetical protein
MRILFRIPRLGLVLNPRLESPAYTVQSTSWGGLSCDKVYCCNDSQSLFRVSKIQMGLSLRPPPVCSLVLTFVKDDDLAGWTPSVHSGSVRRRTTVDDFVVTALGGVAQKPPSRVTPKPANGIGRRGDRFTRPRSFRATSLARGRFRVCALFPLVRLYGRTNLDHDWRRRAFFCPASGKSRTDFRVRSVDPRSLSWLTQA